MIRSVYAKWLRDSRRSIAGWTAAVVLVGCGYAAFWPTFEDPEIAALLDNYPSALLEAMNYTNITTPEGYLGATVYGLVVAVLMRWRPRVGMFAAAVTVLAVAAGSIALGVVGARVGGILLRLGLAALGAAAGFAGALIGAFVLLWAYKTFIQNR